MKGVGNDGEEWRRVEMIENNRRSGEQLKKWRMVEWFIVEVVENSRNRKSG